MCVLPSHAVLSTDDSTSAEYIKKHGYSDEMARLIDLQKSQYNATDKKYKREEPEWYTSNKAVYYIRHAFMYLDSATDDQKFMEHKTNFSNGFNDL